LWPDEPIVAAPNPRAAGMYSMLSDEDGDGRYDSLVIANDPSAEPIGVMRDLDQDSFGGLTIEQLQNDGIDPNPGDFDFEFAVCSSPHSRFAYDTDNDGKVDLVFSDEDHDGEPETTLRYVDREWTIERGTGDLVSADHFTDPILRKSFNGGAGQDKKLKTKRLP
jgi:hypothetical protein